MNEEYTKWREKKSRNIYFEAFNEKFILKTYKTNNISEFFFIYIFIAFPINHSKIFERIFSYSLFFNYLFPKFSPLTTSSTTVFQERLYETNKKTEIKKRVNVNVRYVQVNFDLLSKLRRCDEHDHQSQFVDSLTNRD